MILLLAFSFVALVFLVVMFATKDSAQKKVPITCLALAAISIFLGIILYPISGFYEFEYADKTKRMELKLRAEYLDFEVDKAREMIEVLGSETHYIEYLKAKYQAVDE
ncbi:hypothetical protein HWV00_20920 (plasmid) [Moritella sp. 24]|uniref:hypothetical protein n=1 Tax=Moritella sp. 24 TaxID=2746230 RepID=UPI001BAD9A03|nr:hypothetical protein [Moritella sp. 24]QUM78737.1 hypothetical protein HWV00_20920 [Moritella sp. 24]